MISTDRLLSDEVQPMFVVVCYDISDNRRRTRVGKVLEGYGERVQRSVFECDLSMRHWAGLRRRMERVICPNDLVRYYSLCESCEKRIQIDGPGEVQRTPLAYVV